MSTILIVYGTRRGWTAKSVDILAGELKNQSHEVNVIDIKKTGGSVDISKYDVVLVGSSIAMGGWMGEAESFLDKDFTGKKVGIFVSAGSSMKGARGKPDVIKTFEKKFIDDIAAKHGVTPFAKKMFGGKITVLGVSPLDSWRKEDPVEWAAELKDLI
ncbi:MAG: flavodoxin domain-containing protein [Candidatus Thorarchaeota archaeon]